MVRIAKKLKDIISKEIKENGYISMDNGKTWLTVLPVDDDHFTLTPKFREQLKAEGRYGKKIAFLTNPIKEGEKAQMQWLPIYGNPNKYITDQISSNVIDNALELRYSTFPSGIQKRFDIA